MREWLIESFDYDLWANRLWAQRLGIQADDHLLELGNSAGPWPDFPEGEERAREVFCHIVWANRTWLKRIGREVAFEGYDPIRWLQATHAAWTSELQSRDLAERIQYFNSRGQSGNRSIAEIARHVADHGTYHRGQLREICQGQDFPETSPVGYFASLDS